MMSSEEGKSKRFRLHSIAVELRGKGAERLAQDFDFFTGRPESGPMSGEDNRYSVTLELVARSSGAGDLPETEASRIFPDCVLYRHGNRLYYEYGAAVLQVTRERNSSYAQLICAETALAQEIGY